MPPLRVHAIRRCAPVPPTFPAFKSDAICVAAGLRTAHTHTRRGWTSGLRRGRTPHTAAAAPQWDERAPRSWSRTHDEHADVCGRRIGRGRTILTSSGGWNGGLGARGRGRAETAQNMKKSWHTSTFHNLERVWKAEQAAVEEAKKAEQLRKELAEERQMEEMRRMQEVGGHIK